MPDTIFTKIINREIPATIQYEDENFIAFNDIHPAAPVHILIVTKKPFSTLGAVELTDSATHAGLLQTARKVAEKMGISDNYRLVMNVGPDMQAVPHVHIHLLGGWSEKKREQVKTSDTFSL